MNKFNLSQSGLFFVIGEGFSTSDQSEASALDQAQIDQINAANALYGDEPAERVAIPTPVVAKKFAVAFVRPKDIQGDGTVAAHRLNPSKRRFKTEAEAEVHGNRFKRIEGHRGFYIIETDKPGVDSWINPATGKTNPLMGKSRTDR